MRLAFEVWEERARLGFHCDVVGGAGAAEAIVVCFTECSSKSEECSYSVATGGIKARCY